MRTNSPTDSGFNENVLNPVVDNPLSQDPTPEMKKLAKAAKSPDGKIILDHLKDKINQYTKQLTNTDLRAFPDPTMALATTIATQQMIKEFEVVLNDVQISTKAVADAAKQRARA